MKDDDELEKTGRGRAADPQAASQRARGRQRAPRNTTKGWRPAHRRAVPADLYRSGDLWAIEDSDATRVGGPALLAGRNEDFEDDVTQVNPPAAPVARNALGNVVAPASVFDTAPAIVAGLAPVPSNASARLPLPHRPSTFARPSQPPPDLGQPLQSPMFGGARPFEFASPPATLFPIPAPSEDLGNLELASGTTEEDRGQFAALRSRSRFWSTSRRGFSIALSSFVAIEVVVSQLGASLALSPLARLGAVWAWLVTAVVFAAGSVLTDRWVQRTSPRARYVASMATFVAIEAVSFAPLEVVTSATLGAGQSRLVQLSLAIAVPLAVGTAAWLALRPSPGSRRLA